MILYSKDKVKLYCFNLFGYQQIDELLKNRNEIHASYTTLPAIKRSSSNRSKNRGGSKEASEDGPVRDKKASRDRSKKKKWFNIPLKVDKRKPC